MAFSLAVILLCAFLINELFIKIKLPGLLGMLLLGVALGPYGFNVIDEKVLAISGDLRLIALIVILLRAGFGIQKEELNKVKSTVAKMSCIPGIFEGLTVAFVSIKFLDFSFIQGGILGFILAAVSPAVIVPKMLEFQEKGLGTNKNIPTIVLAGASIDDVIAITLFTSFMGLYGGEKVNLFLKLLGIPLSIGLGVFFGILIGLLFVYIFKHYHIRDTKKVLLILAVSIIFNHLEKVIKIATHEKLEIASLLGIMTLGFVILEKMPNLGKRMSLKFNKMWVFAEIILFVLVGAQVNVGVALKSGKVGIIVLIIGLIARGVGVVVSLLGTGLTPKENLFTIVAYMPKATVQAAIGALPLMAGVEGGEVMLAIAVMSIVLTAPLGAIGIEYFGNKFLTKS